MADRTNADSHHSLALDTLHPPPKDMQGSDKSIPLSPQWLLPKPGDTKHGMVSAGESHQSPYPASASWSGISKTSTNTDDVHDGEKKRDVFRPSLHDLESGRRDRWRDEERDTNSAIRRDRRKDGEKEIGDSRKMDRWVDTPIKQSGDPRRVPSDRWNDSNNRDGNVDQRRDNKWNTRWGPDDKETESWREKSQETARESEMFRNKMPSQVSNQGKEDKEVDHYRPWRSNSSQSRGSGEPPHQPTSTPSRQAPAFGYGRGRGENFSPNFPVGRGRVSSSGSVLNNTSHPHTLGAVLGKGEGSHTDQSSFRYSRIKLLDVYRTTDVRSHQRALDTFFEIPPSLTQAEPLDPLALSAPTPEELVILKGIDKGDIVNSGLPQATKEGPVGRSAPNLAQLGRTKIGSRDDLPSANDDYKEESADNSEKYVHPYGSEMKSEAIHNLHKHRDSKFGVEAWSDPPSHNRANEVPFNREVNMQGSSAHLGAPWRSESPGERSNATSHDWGSLPVQSRPRNSDSGWSHLQKDRDTVIENSPVAQSYYKDQPSWHARDGIHSDYGRESTIKRQLSDVLDREQEARKFLQQPSPEDLSLYYKDPQGEIQGPFSGSDLIGWFEAGYFGIDLQVRVANALPGTPFASLGDVMPHLRAKAKAPPGFGVPKQNEGSEIINKLNFSNLGKVNANTSETDILKTDPRNRNESMNEAENKFLESLMSGSLSSSPLEKFASSGGLHGYMGSNPVGMPHMGLETGNDLSYLLAQRMSLERQRPTPNPHANWSGRDGSSVLPKSELASESAMPHSQIIPSMVDSSHRVPHSQNVDLISLLQNAANKPAPPATNTGVSSWSNFPVQGGLEMRQEKMDMHHNQLLSQAAYGVQQQRLQPQNPQSLSNIIGQSLDNTSGIMTPEKLLSSGLSQDPQMLSLLQQQYLLSQLQLQSQTPVNPQLSLLDKLLLLKQQQQQQQEQQQKQLLLQQHLLSQVLSEQHSHQHLSEPHGHLQGATDSVGNGPVDRLGLRSPYESYQSNSHSPLHNFQGGHPSGLFQSQPSQDAGQHASTEIPMRPLPHQMLDSNFQKVKDVPMKEQLNDHQRKDSLLASATAVSTSLCEVTDNSLHENSVLRKHSNIPDSYPVAEEQALVNDRVDDSSVSVHVTSSKFPGTTESVRTSRTDISNVAVPEEFSNTQNLTLGTYEALQFQKELHSEHTLLNENKGNEALEVKKVSEKKSRKQKSSKANSSSDKAKGASSQVKQSEIEVKPSKDTKIKVNTAATEALQTVVSHQVQSTLPGSKSNNVLESIEIKVQDQPKEGDFTSPRNEQTQSGHRAWKPAPGVKAKSLLEIQQEEQRVAQQQMTLADTATSVNLVSSPLPWTGIVAGMEPKITKDHPEAKSDSSSNPKSKKSQLHDLLAEEVLAKSDEKILQNPDYASGLPSETAMSMQMGSTVDEEDFIQAKDSRKNRKKSGKAKGAGAKVITSVSSAEIPIASSPIEKGKGYRQAQQEAEVLPAPSSGPSLGDFVLWKGESTNSSPVPAWLTDSGKLLKPTSLRDIQKEQGKKNISVPHQAPAPSKPQPTRGNRGVGTSLTPSGSSPSKSASPIQVNSVASTHSKTKADDDLFWGPIDQSKQEAKQPDFPSLANPSKNPSTKGSLGGSSKKLMGIKPAEYSHSPATAQSSLKGKRDAITKHSEAMDFRDWCESETKRLTGSKDTSFLEFCLKQSTSEAEILLRENLGLFDPDHEFIDKFLNYKELLSADVLEIAFQAGSDRKALSFGGRNGNSDSGGLDPNTTNESNKGGGKKKGKKGKKVVSPSVLGFNVVSNRIMMGEIQTVEE